MQDIIKTLIICTIFLFLSLCATLHAASQETDPLSRYNVVWDTPGKNSSGSMPVGNGDIGLNVWVEEDGDLLFYIGKTDAWSENCRLLKLGRVRVKFSPNPFIKGNYFLQTLKLRDGEIEINGGAGEKRINIRIWVDAHRPVIYVDSESKNDFQITVKYENWRNERRQIKEDESHSIYGLNGDNPDPVYVEPDNIVEGLSDRIIWYHHNNYSCYAPTLQHQGLGELLPDFPDPLLHRMFGGCIKGEGLCAVDKNTLRTKANTAHQLISIHLLTMQPDDKKQWLERLQRNVSVSEAADLENSRSEHRKWWNEFWNRSWIYIHGTEDAEHVTRGYILQNWINACGGRGSFPIKFNGSVFTVDAEYKGKKFDADFRQWGGPYWYQNTRLPYLSMLTAGNFDLMQPVFTMYMDALPLAKEMTKIYYKHEGAFFPETMYFWGTYTNANYGWKRDGMPHGLTVNRYIRYLWSGGIELAAMMIEYYHHTEDDRFLQEVLLPFAKEICTFYDRHYPRDEDSLIRLEPAQALETYWDSVNPLPEIAGLHDVLHKLLHLPRAYITENNYRMWKRMQQELPPLPTREIEGEQVLSPAEIIGSKHNVESPELYAIFPFRLYGVGKEQLEMARRTFAQRIQKGTGGWSQDALQAALLGLTADAMRDVVSNFTTWNPESRFPAFWGPNYDWVPDQDHGCVTMIALQRMLMQCDDNKIFLLPAWPKEWQTEFKLHAPLNTTIEGELVNGEIKNLKVIPEVRRKDVIVMEMK